MSNTGDGFLGFQAAIDMVAEDLRNPKLRQAVAQHFGECLRLEMTAARTLKWASDLPWAVFWTMATTAEFDAARRRGLNTLSVPKSTLSEPIVAEGAWGDIRLRLRGTRIYAEGTDYRLSAVNCFSGHTRYDRKLRRDVPQWQISVDKELAEAVRASWYTTKPQTTHAGSLEAGVKSARRMARDFFGVELVDV